VINYLVIKSAFLQTFASPFFGQMSVKISIFAISFFLSLATYCPFSFFILIVPYSILQLLSFWSLTLNLSHFINYQWVGVSVLYRVCCNGMGCCESHPHIFIFSKIGVKKIKPKSNKNTCTLLHLIPLLLYYLYLLSFS